MTTPLSDPFDPTPMDLQSDFPHMFILLLSQPQYPLLLVLEIPTKPLGGLITLRNLKISSLCVIAYCVLQLTVILLKRRKNSKYFWKSRSLSQPVHTPEISLQNTVELRYNENFVIMRRNISIINMLMLHIQKNFIQKRAFSSKWEIQSQLQLFLTTFCMNCNCRFASQTLYSWWSIKVPLNHQECWACRALLICGWKTLVDNCKYKIFKLLGSDTTKYVEMLNSSSLFSCLYDNHFKQMFT
jgi:hypothetical protein